MWAGGRPPANNSTGQNKSERANRRVRVANIDRSPLNGHPVTVRQVGLPLVLDATRDLFVRRTSSVRLTLDGAEVG